MGKGRKCVGCVLDKSKVAVIEGFRVKYWACKFCGKVHIATKGRKLAEVKTGIHGKYVQLEPVYGIKLRPITENDQMIWDAPDGSMVGELVVSGKWSFKGGPDRIDYGCQIIVYNSDIEASIEIYGFFEDTDIGEAHYEPSKPFKTVDEALKFVDEKMINRMRDEDLEEMGFRGYC